MARVALIPPEQAPLLLRKRFANGDPGALVASLAQVPELVDPTLAFVGRSLGPSWLDARTKEIVILRASALQGCRFCVQTHTAVALRSGLGQDEVRALRGPGDAQEAFSDPSERALIAFTDAASLPGPVDPALVAALKSFHGDAGVVELTLLVGATVMLNRYCTTLDLPASQATLSFLEEAGLLEGESP